MKGTTVTFKGIIDPGGAAWPSGKPVWGGTAGANGTGETKDVAFNATGDQTVTTECGNTVTVNVKVYELTGYHAPKDWFTGRATTKYGAAEGVDLSFTVNPVGITAAQMGGLSWSLVSGDGDVDNSGTSGTGTYTAHWTNSVVTIRLSVQSGPSKGNFVDAGLTVVKPTGVRFIQKPNSGIWHVQYTSTIGFKGWFYLDPKDVSFKNILRGARYF
jgi:hypothetical protein